ncbi:hypothetical protein ACFL6H_08725 [Candidatus Latescibacterota bacterium]
MRSQGHHFLFQLILLFYFSFSFAVFSDPSDSFLGDDIDFEDIFSDIPRNFNLEKAVESEIAALPYFNNESARNVVYFRDSLESIESIGDNIDNFPELTPIQKTILTYLSQDYYLREFGSFSGHIRNGYMGSPGDETISDGKYYIKLSAEKDRNLKFTVIGERDSFEPRAVDLFSANLSMKIEKTGMHIVLGDYRPEFGQHLIFSRYGRNYSTGIDAMTHNSKIVGNSLFDESLYLRGGYLSFKRGNFITEIFSSLRKLDATLNESGNAVTIRNTGYHYSGTARENLTETINTARVEFNDQNKLKFGISGVVSRYSPSLARKTEEKYINYPEGSKFGYVSFDGEITNGLSVMFFEHVESSNNEHATLAGLRIKNKKAGGSVVLRNYSKGYWAPRPGGFSSFGNTSNERGVYSALQAELPHNSNIMVSMDISRTLSRTFSETMPLSRRRLSLLLISGITDNVSGRFIARSATDSSANEERWSCRFLLERSLKNKRKTGIRSSVAWSQSGNDGGAYSDITVFSNMQKIKINASIGIFNIPSYDSRFYRYEYDVPGRGLTRAVWGEGAASSIVFTGGPLSFRYRIADSDLFDKISEISLQSDYIF